MGNRLHCCFSLCNQHLFHNVMAVELMTPPRFNVTVMLASLSQCSFVCLWDQISTLHNQNSKLVGFCFPWKLLVAKYGKTIGGEKVFCCRRQKKGGNDATKTKSNEPWTGNVLNLRRIKSHMKLALCQKEIT